MPKFSLVYPTRHRPQFVRQALRVLAHQGHDDFEIVVCDNFTDPLLSCRTICEESSLPNIKYVRPPRPLGMVANWNHALTCASGEYVCFFTDKMYLLPGALARIARVIRRAGNPDIVSWASDTYSPSTYDDYFGAGRYFRNPSDVRSGKFESFDPKGELDRKGSAEIPRTAQTPSHYARGKICFGAFSRDLIDRIRARYGDLFQGINPDYTSMIFGLTEARGTVEIARPCVVSVGTDISNGQLVDTHDARALAFLGSLDDADAKMANLMVPGLYSAISNLVAHDYLALQRRYGLSFKFNEVNWLAYCLIEVNRPGRVWSSEKVEARQKQLLASFIAGHGPDVETRVAAKVVETDARTTTTAPRYVLPFDSLDAAMAWRKRRFRALRMLRAAGWKWFQVKILGHPSVQATVMRPSWPGRRLAQKLYHGLKGRLG